MILLNLAFTLSVIGIFETIYLIHKRVHSLVPVCPIGTDCTTVLKSKYSKTFFIPNDTLGLIAYGVITLLILCVILGIGSAYMFTLLILLVFISSLFSIYLTYLQWKVIKTWCFWCLMSAVTIWLITIILLINYLPY